MLPRLLPALLLATLALASLAPGPPGRSPAASRLIERLGDEDADVRARAAKELEALGERALPALRKAARSDPDVDVRLRAALVVRAIEGKNWGLLRAFGPGAPLKAAPFGLGYWLNRVAFTPDGKYAVACGGGLILYDLETGKEVKRVLEVGGGRPGLAMSRDGRHGLTGHGSSPDFHLVEVPSLKIVRGFRGHVGGLYAVALSPDGNRAASAGSDDTLRLWDVRTVKELRRFTGAGSPRCLAFSPDGKRLLSGQAAGVGKPLVRLWDVETGKLLRSLEGHDGHVTAVAFLPGGKRALSAGGAGHLRLWDLDRGEELRRMTHKGLIHDAAVSPDGRRALSAGYNDNTVRVWDLGTGTVLHAFAGHIAPVLGVAFSADGKRALSSDAVGCLRLWKLGR
jgi:WD40 repeat protein